MMSDLLQCHSLVAKSKLIFFFRINGTFHTIM